MTHAYQNMLSVGALVLALAAATGSAVWVVAQEIEEIRGEVRDELGSIDERLDAITIRQTAMDERHKALADNIERIERSLDALPQKIAEELQLASRQPAPPP